MMNPLPPDMIKKDNVKRPYCCGCINNEVGSIFVCFFWGMMSFYFAVLAFMQKSPFYSYTDTVGLVVFGVINLFFGLVSLCSMIIFLLVLRGMQHQIIRCYDKSRYAIFSVALTAIGVLIITIVNFILFLVNKSEFFAWCIGSSTDHIMEVYNKVNSVNDVPSLTLYDHEDFYNCQRLYMDEVKWSLLCLILMVIVYVGYCIYSLKYVLILMFKRYTGY
ncbi:hypothetical protein BDB01DRAFT_778499 [Pilobolus umbonatus]|nr:hypothetical protein BDB01DRAFT_778499 [Pilobolus umbonatus]